MQTQPQAPFRQRHNFLSAPAQINHPAITGVLNRGAVASEDAICFFQLHLLFQIIPYYCYCQWCSQG